MRDRTTRASWRSKLTTPIPQGAASLEWDDLRYFLALARKGNLSATARALNATQPTLRRRLAALEAKLGARSFQRMPSGLRLTDAGDAILHFATAMDEAALASERVAMGRDAGLSGTVRVTAPNFFGPRILSGHIGRFCAEHPAITVELVTDARLANLARREAERAFRLRRFEGGGIHQSKVAELPFGIYAAPAYLARCGPPAFSRGGTGSETVVMDQAGIDPVAAAAGASLVCLPCRLGDDWAGLVKVATPTPIPTREVWLGMHADTRKVPRVRALAGILSATCVRRAALRAVPSGSVYGSSVKDPKFGERWR